MSSLGTIVYLPNHTLSKEIGRTTDNYAGIIGINWNHPEQVLHHMILNPKMGNFLTTLHTDGRSLPTSEFSIPVLFSDGKL